MSSARRRRGRATPDAVSEADNAIGEAAEALADGAQDFAARFLDWLGGEPAEHLDRARRREITVRSARTPLERRAVRRAAYEGRKSTVQPGESVRARLGHGQAPVVTWSEVPTTAGLVELTTRSRVETRRVAQYSRDVLGLLDGDLEPAAFRRRWSRRKRDVGSFELEADSDKVIVLRAESGPPAEPYYRRHVPVSSR